MTGLGLQGRGLETIGYVVPVAPKLTMESRKASHSDESFGLQKLFHVSTAFLT
jgi:hypothetical protein